MIQQVIFQPTGVTGADGWTETGAPLLGPPQPPNRALPAPIFDVGTQYQPNNGAVGYWLIEKTVVSDVAGPGRLTIPTGAFPSSGGIFADDQTVAIRLNGVTIPFTGLGTGNIPPQSQPVTWLAGSNVVQIEVRNTVAGGTAVTGAIIAEGVGLPIPCDCCPTGQPQCALGSVQFATAAETASQAGWNQVDLAATADGITATTALSGYNTAVGNTPSTTLRITYTTGAAQNRVRGVRLWNQAGSDLNDADGLRNFTAEFYAGVTLLATQSWTAVNGGQAQTFTLPLGTELTGVTSVVLRTLDKQIGGSVAPLWRELQLLTFQTVFPCRRRSGALEWYDQQGNLLAASDVVVCDEPTPFVTTTLTMTTSAFGDDPSGTAENMCNVVPTPTTATGWTLAGACYDPVVGNPSFTWSNASSAEMEYGDNGNGQPSGAVFIAFTPAGFPAITWPTNLSNMVIGEQRLSNVFGGGHRARLTYLSGPPHTATSGTIRMNGGSTLAVHPLDVSSQLPIRFRIDLVNA